MKYDYRSSATSYVHPAVLPWDGPFLLCLVDLLLQDLRGRRQQGSAQKEPPCAELWNGPMSRRLGSWLAEIGKVYDIRHNLLLGGLSLIVWCILL